MTGEYTISGEQYGELLRLSLAHCVICPSGDRYCTGCELAERILLIDPNMAERLDALDMDGPYHEEVPNDPSSPNTYLRAFWVRDELPPFLE